MNPKNSRFRYGLARQALLLALLLPGLAAAAQPAAAPGTDAATTSVADARAAAADTTPIRLAWDRVGIQMT